MLYKTLYSIDRESTRHEERRQRNEFSISSRAHRRFTTQRQCYAMHNTICHSKCWGNSTTVQIVLAKVRRISVRVLLYHCAVFVRSVVGGPRLIWQMSDSRILLSTSLRNTHTYHTNKLGGKWILPARSDWYDWMGDVCWLYNVWTAEWRNVRPRVS